MRSTLSALFALSSLAVVHDAQTPASTKVIVPCTQPAPAGSLVAEPTLPITYTDPDNVVVMEMESQEPIGSWVEEDILSGFGGESYFRWNGPDLFNTPNVDTLTFRFEINKADDYLIRLHVRHDAPDPSAENDCWARLNGGTWEKLYHNTGPSGVGVWTFNARYESTNDFPKHPLNRGTHTWEISGRSKNFKIDRIHVLPLSVWTAQLSDPESDVARARPIIGTQMAVEIDDPTGSAGMVPAFTRTAWYVGAIGPDYPCGMSSPFGELLITGAGGSFRIGGFKPWMGPGQPNVHRANIPDDIDLVGLTIISQSVLIQPDKVVFGEGLEMTIGDM